MAGERKKLLIINSVCGTGSTGRICADIARKYENDGYEVKIAYGRSAYVPDDCRKYAVRIGSTAEVYLHILYTRLTDRHGLASRRATRAFLKWADEFDPDILWLHNVHGYYINYELLFNWIKKRPQMQVRWKAFLKKITKEADVSFAEVVSYIQIALKPYWEKMSND